MKAFSFFSEDGHGWFRFGSRGPGIAWKPRNARAYFSERNGFQRWYRIGRWRVSFVERSRL